MSDVTDKNPLIDTLTAESLDRCADVLDYIALYDGAVPGEPIDNIKCGKTLILDCVISALRYESERAGEQLRSRPKAVSTAD